VKTKEKPGEDLREKVMNCRARGTEDRNLLQERLVLYFPRTKRNAIRDRQQETGKHYVLEGKKKGKQDQLP